MSSTTSDDDGSYNRRGRCYPTLMERVTSRLTLENTCRAYDESRDLIYDLSRSIDHDSRLELASLIGSAHFTSARTRDWERRMRRRLDGWSRVTGWRRRCATSFARRRRRCQRSGGAGASLILLSCNTKTRKTTGYSQCAFASRAPSRKDAAGILAGAERCAILIVTEKREKGEAGGESSFFLLLDVRAPRICITMFRHGRARECLQTSSLFLFFAHVTKNILLVSRARETRGRKPKNPRVI